MGCNCGGQSGTTAWYYVSPSGQEYKYKTEVEARAALIRAGNQGSVKSQ